MFGSLIAGLCTAIVLQYVRTTIEPDRNLCFKNNFSEILGRFTFSVCVVYFIVEEIIANRTILLTEMACESQTKSNNCDQFYMAALKERDHETIKTHFAKE